MRLSNIAIEEVITEVAGQDVIPLVMVLKNKKNVSEFKLADSIKQEVNITRNMLYRLYNSNLVSFIRKKDKKKGWYIYYWTLDLKRVRYLVSELKKKRLKQLKERLERESEGQFFICPNNCIRLDFDQAMNFEFKCPECGTIIEQEDNTELKRKLEGEIKELEGELKGRERVEIVEEVKVKKKKVKHKKVKKKVFKKIKLKIKKKRIIKKKR
jgi:transcription initiation factor TFIIE subunit alpha